MAGATAASTGGAAAAATGAGSPCGACKFLRRRCVPECVFAPYFSTDQGAARFAAIHKVFGASNASKLLSHLPVADRCEAVVTITYEAQARLRDPVYGCVAQIFALQQQVAILQAQLMQAKAQAQLACGAAAHSPPLSHHHHHQWPADHASSIRKPGGPLDDCFMPDPSGGCFRDDVVAAQHCAAKADAGDLQYLAQAMMMRSPNYSL